MTTTNDPTPDATRDADGAAEPSASNFYQVPPISQGQAVELAFRAGGQVVVAVAATGTDPNLGGVFAQNTEYWHYQAISLAGVSSFPMTLSSGAFTAAQINSFFAGIPFAFQAGQIVGAWTQGTSPTLSGCSAYLFRAPDPDDSKNKIGLLVQQDNSTKLVSISWYKSSQPTNGWVWQPQNSPLNGLSWAAVLNGGQPTVDPNYIQAGKTWWYYAQP